MEWKRTPRRKYHGEMKDDDSGKRSYKPELFELRDVQVLLLSTAKAINIFKPINKL